MAFVKVVRWAVVAKVGYIRLVPGAQATHRIVSSSSAIFHSQWQGSDDKCLDDQLDQYKPSLLARASSP